MSVNKDTVEYVLQDCVSKHMIAGASLLIRKDGIIVCDLEIGFADRENKLPITQQTLFRYASMTKPITAIAIMQLEEKGKISLQDTVKKYYSSFSNMKVCNENFIPEVFIPDSSNVTGGPLQKERLNSLDYVSANKDISILHLLTHSSGLGMGPVGSFYMGRLPKGNFTLQDKIKQYGHIPLDFQPGTRSGYSPYAGFEVLGGIIEKVSDMPFEEYLYKYVFEPLEMESVSFKVPAVQQTALACLYNIDENNELKRVDESQSGFNKMGMKYLGYPSGAAGLIGTLADYEKIAQLLLNKGEINNKHVLKPETVKRMVAKNSTYHLHLTSGVYWGLGMVVFENYLLNHRFLENGSFGWSGAFGTHFYVDMLNHMDVVLGISRNDIGGAASFISQKVEKAIYHTMISRK